MTFGPAKNTDRELYREDTGDPAGSYYENSVHVTESGSIGMNVGGTVVVQPIADWHRQALSDHRPMYGPTYGVRMDTTCAVHRHRELVPIERHHIHPLGEGGPDVEANKVTVCANGHMSIHALLTLILKADKKRLSRDDPWEPAVPWKTMRNYGRGVRKYARQGYDAIQAQKAGK